MDYENIQEINLAGLIDAGTSVRVFVGKNQNKIPFDLANQMQILGSNAEWVKIDGSGPNALDFHIAFALGELIATNKYDEYLIISKDTGFDPLIKSIAGKGIKVNRLTEIKSKTITKNKQSNSQGREPENMVDVIVKRINSETKPRTEKTLKNWIKSQLGTKGTSEKIDEIYIELISKMDISINNGKLEFPS
ncbi:MAG TPA: PIN domain-containing protein [Fibrobacteria bacterium]|nr:PIN domain-containing protein [Fibrobacteria bacterium]